MFRAGFENGEQKSRTVSPAQSSLGGTYHILLTLPPFYHLLVLYMYLFLVYISLRLERLTLILPAEALFSLLSHMRNKLSFVPTEF